MIAIALPKTLIPTHNQHTFEHATYFGKSYHCMREVTFVDLCGHTMDDQYEDQEFFIELSGNDFVKLVERDALPEWASPELLFKHSTAHGVVDPVTRKITWIRPKNS